MDKTQHRYSLSKFRFWGVTPLILLVLLFSGCKPNSTAANSEEPAAKVEDIAGSQLKRVVLSDKAAQRLSIKTQAVRKEQVMRKRKVGGEVLTSSSPIKVQVSLSKNELSKVNQEQNARVVLLTDEGGKGFAAKLTGVTNSDPDQEDNTLQYVINDSKANLKKGQRVFVELPLSAPAQRTLIPYAAVIYDLNGDTWVYTNPQPLTYERAEVDVDYIEGDNAVLSEDLPAATVVVTDGVSQLFGTEFGIGESE